VDLGTATHRKPGRRKTTGAMPALTHAAPAAVPPPPPPVMPVPSTVAPVVFAQAPQSVDFLNLPPAQPFTAGLAPLRPAPAAPEPIHSWMMNTAAVVPRPAPRPAAGTRPKTVKIPAVAAAPVPAPSRPKTVKIPAVTAPPPPAAPGGGMTYVMTGRIQQDDLGGDPAPRRTRRKTSEFKAVKPSVDDDPDRTLVEEIPLESLVAVQDVARTGGQYFHTDAKSHSAAPRSKTGEFKARK
jgi:hypothetical protein